MEIDYSSAGFWTLMAATFILATTHSVNPDHWFPFVMVGRAKKWRLSMVLLLAAIAGLGHTGTSVFIGLAGVFAKTGTAKEIAEFLESVTPLLLMVFGFGYAGYSLYKMRVGTHGHSHGLPFVNRLLGIDPHDYETPRYTHDHDHDQDHDHHHHDHDHDVPHADHPASSKGITIGKINFYLHNMDLHITVAHDDHTHDYDASAESDHGHRHAHSGVIHTHEHFHVDKGKTPRSHSHDGHEHHHHGHGLKDARTGLGLVAILGLTPCIALLPMTFAAVKYGTLAIILVNICFSLATIGTIMILTWLGYLGLSWIKLDFFDMYGDVIAGMIIGLIGLATKVFGL